MSKSRRYFLLLPLFVASVACTSTGTATAETCSQFAKYYASLGHSPLDVPRAAAASGISLAVCPLTTATCCTSKAENGLVLSSKKWLQSGLTQVTRNARPNLHRLSLDIDEFFAGLLQRAQKELHDMFKRAYGIQYLQNSDVFDRLFGRFRGYYGGSDDDLAATVRSFFADIFSRMYKMINAADKAVTSAYLDRCVGGQLERLAPFGDIPERLGQGVKRALVVARTFMQGLSVGHHAFLAATNWVQNPSTSCLRTVTRLLHCAACENDGAAAYGSNSSDNAAASVQPRAQKRMACHDSCTTAVRSCYDSPFADGWDKYVSAMDAVGARLEDEGAFNLESVLGPLKDSISAAIMDYNSNQGDIEKKIATIPGCQKAGGQRLPTQSESRGKRSAAVTSRRERPQLNGFIGSSSSEQTLRRLMTDARSHLRRLRGMWKNLESHLCVPNMGVAAPSNGSCSTTAAAAAAASRAGTAEPSPDRSLNASEFSLDAAAPSLDDDSMVNTTRLLKLVTEHLKEALGEQRNITWLRVQNSEFLTPSDADDLGAGVKGDSSGKAGIPGSGSGPDTSDESSGSGDNAVTAGVHQPSKQPRPSSTWQYPRGPLPTGPSGRRPPWDNGPDDTEPGSADGSGALEGEPRAAASYTRGPPHVPLPTAHQRVTTGRPQQSGATGSRRASNAGSSATSHPWSLWRLCLLAAAPTLAAVAHLLRSSSSSTPLHI